MPNYVAFRNPFCGLVPRLLTAVAIATQIALAQPIPKLNSISHEWVQRGREVELTVMGENIGKATGFLISGDAGVTAVLQGSTDRPAVSIESSKGGISFAEVRDDKSFTAKVTIKSDARLG